MAEIFVMSFLFIITFAVLSTGIFQRDFAFLQLEEREHYFTEATILKKKKHSADNTANSKQRCSYLPSVKGDDLLELKEKLNNFRFPPVSAQITAT
ncbi:hypothetical protein ABK040_003291 [Willaertia magna]